MSSTNDNSAFADAAALGFNSVLAEISAERQRQIAKGYDAAHDDALPSRLLASKAALRIARAVASNDRQLLVEAAALIVAQLQRLDRAALGASGAS